MQRYYLSQQGDLLPVDDFLEITSTEDLSNEAEIAMFIYESVNTSDQLILNYLIDAWMAKLIENQVPYNADEHIIDWHLKNSLNHLKYKFLKQFDTDRLLSMHSNSHKYSDIDTLYDFIDSVDANLESLHIKLNLMINQLFSKVEVNNNHVVYRITSFGYSWSNAIKHTFNELNLEESSLVSVIRDNENTTFYKLKDNTLVNKLSLSSFTELCDIAYLMSSNIVRNKFFNIYEAGSCSGFNSLERSLGVYTDTRKKYIIAECKTFEIENLTSK